MSGKVLLVSLVLAGAFALLHGQTALAWSVPTMCGIKAEPRTQTVFIDTGDPAITGISREDVLAAMSHWNTLFEKYHGLPIFAPYDGNWWDADILITAMGSETTWVNTQCEPHFVQRGNNKSVIYIGRKDAWRNAEVIGMELGHSLGLPDWENHPTADYINPQPCGSYLGVMSSCAGPQTWFMDVDIPGLILDGQLVRDYWQEAEVPAG
jgi:hypothetical protein